MMLATLLRGRLPKERSRWAGLQPVPGHRGRWPRDISSRSIGWAHRTSKILPGTGFRARTAALRFSRCHDGLRSPGLPFLPTAEAGGLLEARTVNSAFPCGAN